MGTVLFTDNWNMGELTAASASSFQAAKIGSEINVAVASKVLQSQRLQGAGVLSLLQAATGTGAGGKILAGDSLIAAATGLGGTLDVTA